jgi:hypothetical protein
MKQAPCERTELVQIYLNEQVPVAFIEELFFTVIASVQEPEHEICRLWIVKYVSNSAKCA